MRIVRKIKIFSFVTAFFAALMLAAPGYSWTGQHNHGSGGYRNQGYHNNYGHRQYGHGYYNGHRRYGHSSWNGYYGASGYPHYYRSNYYTPSVSFALPFPFFLPGFAFYMGP